MQNSMGIFTFLGFSPKCLFWTYLVHKFVCSGKNLLPRLVWMCRTQWFSVLCIYFRLKTPFLGNFGPKNENCQFQLKFHTKSNSNMKNSMVNSLFFNSTPFYGNLFQKIKIVCWSWNLELRLIWLCKIRYWCPCFMFWTFFAIIVQNIHLAY